MTKVEEFLKLVQENPELPIIPLVNEEVVADDCSSWWLGEWGHSKIIEYYKGKERIHFKDDDEEAVLCDMVDCKYSETKDGRDIYDLSDEEWTELFNSLDWIKAIAVYIDV